MSSNREHANAFRAALKAIRHEVQQVVSTDQNPSKANLYRIDRIASEALKEER